MHFYYVTQAIHNMNKWRNKEGETWEEYKYITEFAPELEDPETSILIACRMDYIGESRN